MLILMSKAVILGITGTIASGKSAFTENLVNLGFKTLSADKIVGDLCQKDQKGYIGLIKLGLTNLTDNDGHINKSFFRELVFGDDKIRKQVEVVLHPLVIENIKQEIAKLKQNEKLAVEIPLLFETGLQDICTYTVAVCRGNRAVIDSVAQRYSISKIEAEKLLKIQMSVGEKIIKADFVVMNSNSLKGLNKKAAALSSVIDGLLTNDGK